jgi:protein ImuB
MFACIYIPDFPVQASLLPESTEIRADLNRSPIAILDGPANLPRVFAMNSAARRAGIQIGMTKLQAEICAGIELRKRSLVEEDSAQAALLECAAAFSPRVESTSPGAAILDLAGTEKLFSGRKSDPQKHAWQNAAQDIAAKAAARGLNARIAIAANPDAAFLAARGFLENTIIPVGNEARCLASLPVETLPLAPAMLETLVSWGIRTLHSLAELSAVAIVERLGQEGLYIQKLARGANTRPLLTCEPDADFAASFEFDNPVETLESIFFILTRLLQDLCSRLFASAQAASELRLTVGLNVRQLAAFCGREERERQRAAPSRSRAEARLSPERSRRAAIAILSEPSGESKDFCEHVWKLPFPTQDRNLLFSLLRLHLEQITFSAPVRSLRLEVIPVKPRLAQGDLFIPPSPEPEQIEITLDRVRGVVGNADENGANYVGSPHLLDTHKPGSFTVHNFSGVSDTENPKNSQGKRDHHPEQWHPERNRLFRKAKQLAESKDLYSILKSEDSGTSSFSTASLTALRIFRPALETAVELDGVKPHFVRLWNRHRRVLAASGPWSTSGNWWSATAWTREEWDVVLQTPAGPGFYRIYRDRLRSQWFVEGVFD